ncbi:hypothetical protein CC86DRAFT_404520 [Ophiobolus disseminans]|uniref:Rhodopsin domain-containing protein n=1 Tax=Ophiobolus disseminans TaxID=1469910 RepID=A0A6A7A7F0_9PLEO|nr:hypothetical protein CC86DRAFT_404520 [Ophiobolus disseminans]
MLLIAFVRVYSKWYITRKWGWDDNVFLVSLAAALIFIALCVACAYGYHAWEVKIGQLTKAVLMRSFILQVLAAPLIWTVKLSVYSLIFRAFRPLALSSNKYQQPIYTLHLPGSRIYVVNSASLIPAVKKQIKVLAFPPIEAAAAKNVCGSSKVANDIIETNLNGDEGPRGYSITHYPAVRLALYPGAGLDAMNRVMAQKVGACIDEMGQKLEVKLFAFIKNKITFATTEAVYGPHNPFRDPKLEESFWSFQPGFMILLMQFFPSVFAKESLAARDTITKAFVKYFNNQGHREGSALIQTRFDHSTEYKIPLEDIARLECGGAAGLWETTPMPDFGIDVTITQRADANDALEWRVLMTDSDKGVEVSAEDM